MVSAAEVSPAARQAASSIRHSAAGWPGADASAAARSMAARMRASPVSRSPSNTARYPLNASTFRCICTAPGSIVAAAATHRRMSRSSPMSRASRAPKSRAVPRLYGCSISSAQASAAARVARASSP